MAAVIVEAFRQAEIGDVRLVVGVEQDVGGLEVPMEEAAIVRVLDGAGNEDEVPRRDSRGQRTVNEALGQTGSVNVVHAVERPERRLADLVDADDMGMS
ncbi:MAG: hypothetical protein U0793_22710 [Gemmataceae bacterium]